MGPRKQQTFFFKYMQYTYIVRLHTLHLCSKFLMLRHDLSFFLSIGFPELFFQVNECEGHSSTKIKFLLGVSTIYSL